MVEIYNGLDPPIGSQNYKTAHIKLSCHMSVSMHPYDWDPEFDEQNIQMHLESYGLFHNSSL